MPSLSHQCGQMIRRITFPDCRQVNKQIGDVFLQILLPVLVDHRQVLKPWCGHGRRQWPPDRGGHRFIWAESQRLTNGPTVTSIAPWVL